MEGKVIKEEKILEIVQEWLIFGRYVAGLRGSCVTRGYAKLNPDLRYLVASIRQRVRDVITAEGGITK
jgi:hypothetical protein